MTRVLIIIIVILLNIPVYSQEYFNKRFDFSQSGIWDGATSTFLISEGYIIGGVTGTGIDDPWPRIGFYKTDFLGNKIFSKVYGDALAMYYLGNPGSIIRFNDSIVVVSGSTKKYIQNMEYNEGLLLFMTNSFDTLFTKSYGEKVTPKDTFFILNQVKKVGSNQLIVVGSKYPYGFAEKILLLKTDYQGSPIWERTYGSTAYYQGHSVICISDGGYAIGGFTRSPMPPPNYSGDPAVVKTDSAGNQKWLKILGGPYYDTQGMICNTSDGNMILGFCYCEFMTGSNSYRRINLIKLDNAGNIIWDYKYGAIELDNTLLNIRENTDGSIIFTGIVIKEFQTDYKYMGWIMKTTSNGDSLWYRQYDICKGEGSWHYLYNVIQTPDNGYLACGVVYPKLPDTGSQDGWVIKLDSLGCEAPGECWVGMKQENDILAKDQLSIYPNPAREQVNFIIRKTKEEVRIELFDIFGRKVKELKVPEGIEKTILDISDLPAGLYITVVESGERIIGREKLVVE